MRYSNAYSQSLVHIFCAIVQIFRSIFTVYDKQSPNLFRGILIKDCEESWNFYGSSNIGIEQNKF